MIAPVKTILFGATDPSQAAEAALLGVDGVIVAVGPERGEFVTAARAAEVLAALPPLTARWVLLEASQGSVEGCTGAITPRHGERPPGAMQHLLRLNHLELDAEGIPSDIDGAWVRPDQRAASSATAFDYHRLEKLARRLKLMLEIPDGAAGVETAVRLGHPYAVIFGESVWCHPGIVDLDRLETAMGVVARLNKAAYL